MLSREDTLDNGAYLMAGDKTLMSKTDVTWCKVYPITLWMVEAYPATIGWHFWPSAYTSNIGIVEVPLWMKIAFALTYLTFTDIPLTTSLSLHLLTMEMNIIKEMLVNDNEASLNLKLILLVTNIFEICNIFYIDDLYLYVLFIRYEINTILFK